MQYITHRQPFERDRRRGRQTREVAETARPRNQSARGRRSLRLRSRWQNVHTNAHDGLGAKAQPALPIQWGARMSVVLPSAHLDENIAAHHAFVRYLEILRMGDHDGKLQAKSEWLQAERKLRRSIVGGRKAGSSGRPAHRTGGSPGP